MMSVASPFETPIMKEVNLRKQEIEEKLMEDMRKRDLIKKNLEKADQLTEQMVATLDHFDERLKKLENTILPVHRQTKDLQRLQDNVEKTMNSLDHVIGYHRVAHSVTPVIQKPVGRVSVYIDSMKKLQGAIEFFSENSPGSLELNNVSSLFGKGNEMLEKEFQVCLTKHTRPCTAVYLLDLISKDKSELPDFLPEIVVDNLSEIAKWLTSVDKNTAYIDSYAMTRRKHLINSLEIVRDHVRSLSAGPMRKTAGNLATPKRSMAKVTTLRKMSGMLKKDNIPAGATGSSLGKNLTVPGIEEADELEIKPFISMASVILKLLYIEHKLMQRIIPANFHRQVFVEIINGTLTMIETAFNKFLHYSKQCIENRDHSSIINIFPVAHYLRKDQRDYQEILKEADEHNRKRIPRLLAQLHDNGRNVLEEFIDTVKSDPEKESNMPKDGTVHELTSNTMMFVQQLAANADVAGRMLSSSNNSEQNHRLCLAQYLSSILAALKLNLDKKSRTYDDTSLRSIFLLNNYHFIITALVRENQLELIRQATANIDQIYYSQIEEAKTSFMQLWRKVHTLLVVADGNIDIAPGTKLKDKERQTVKDKFKAFNNEFEELVRVQQKWAIPNQEIKAEVREQIRNLLLPPFTGMYNKFRLVQFTKNIDKYLKYTPDTVTAEIEKLFSQATS